MNKLAQHAKCVSDSKMSFQTCAYYRIFHQEIQKSYLNTFRKRTSKALQKDGKQLYWDRSFMVFVPGNQSNKR